MEYRCLIADDEPIARQILRNYIEQIPGLTCIAECKNAIEAMSCIHSEALGIDIAFLDISMPNLSGMAMARMLRRRLPIVFTTAHVDYAVESYEIDAVDYLLKPFLFERFAKAAFKAMERVHAQKPTPPPNNLSVTGFYLKSEGENHLIVPADILYCEAMKNYTKVVLINGKQYFPLVPISRFEADMEQLGHPLLRVHRSFLVARQHLGALGRSYVMVGEHKIPLGYQYRDAFWAEVSLQHKKGDSF